MLSEYLKSDDFKALGKFIQSRRKTFNIRVYPSNKDIFAAFRLVSPNELKAVVVNFEPAREYQSNGLAFGSNGAGAMPLPTCLIYKEYENTIWNGLDLLFDYSMTHIAKKGVLMLNLALTVDSRESHVNEWLGFTKYLLTKLNGKCPFFIIGEKAFGCSGLIPNSEIKQYDKVLGSNVFYEIEKLTDIKFKNTTKWKI